MFFYTFLCELLNGRRGNRVLYFDFGACCFWHDIINHFDADFHDYEIVLPKSHGSINNAEFKSDTHTSSTVHFELQVHVTARYRI